MIVSTVCQRAGCVPLECQRAVFLCDLCVGALCMCLLCQRAVCVSFVAVGCDLCICNYTLFFLCISLAVLSAICVAICHCHSCSHLPVQPVCHLRHCHSCCGSCLCDCALICLCNLSAICVTVTLAVACLCDCALICLCNLSAICVTVTLAVAHCLCDCALICLCNLCLPFQLRSHLPVQSVLAFPSWSLSFCVLCLPFVWQVCAMCHLSLPLLQTFRRTPFQWRKRRRQQTKFVPPENFSFVGKPTDPLT